MEETMKRPLIAVMIVLMLATLACSINLNIPRIETGASQTMSVSEPVPDSKQPTKLTLEMGAGTLNLAGGADGLVEGTIKYNVANWQPTIEHPAQNEVILNQSSANSFEGIPTNNIVNDWQLKLNSSKPLDLTVNAGAYTGYLDLSKLHLTNLAIKDGASKTRVIFDSPNPEKMENFTYTTGASQVELRGLANANFASMTFESGAGDYTLDFSGTLAQDTTVDIKTGVSNMTIDIPLGMNAKIISLGAIANITPEGTWTVNDSTYTVSGDGYNLTIHISMSVGNLKLVHR
jgi:hypothetical protein